MKLDVLSLIKSEEICEYLRKNKELSIAEKVKIIYSCYYPIEDKLKFIKMLLEETKDDSYLAEQVRLYEYIVDFIHRPSEDVIYMSVYSINGYEVDENDNHYNLSEGLMGDTHYFTDLSSLMGYWGDEAIKWTPHDKISVDIILIKEKGTKYEDEELVQPIWFDMACINGRMEIYSFGINKDWFVKQGFSRELLDESWQCSLFRTPLPFENGCRVKLQTPAMLEPVYGIMDSSQDYYGCWYNYLWLEDDRHGAEYIRSMLNTEEYNIMKQQKVECINVSYIQLDSLGEYLTYDWLQRADN